MKGIVAQDGTLKINNRSQDAHNELIKSNSESFSGPGDILVSLQ